MATEKFTKASKRPIEGLLCDECITESLRKRGYTSHHRIRYRCINPKCVKGHTSHPIKISDHKGPWDRMPESFFIGDASGELTKADLASEGTPVNEPGKPKRLKGEDVEFEDDGKNHGTMQFKAPDQLTTLADLLAVAQVDLKIWEVEKAKVNKWDTTIKVPDAGRGKGYYKGEAYPNYQVKADLIRRMAVKHQWPPVTPVTLSPKLATFPSKKATGKKTYSVLFVPDSQTGYRWDYESQSLIPFHDRRAWDLALQIARISKPDIIVFLGDMLDLPTYSDKFVKGPDFFNTTQPALEENFYWFYQFAQLGAELIYLEGNHEDRLYKATVKNDIENFYIRPANQPDAPRILSIENMSGLHELGIKYVGKYPTAEHWFTPFFCTRHGDLSRGEAGESVKAMLKRINHWEVSGHTHHFEMGCESRMIEAGKWRTIQAMSSGTISRIDGKVTPAAVARLNWHQAVTWAHFDTVSHVSLGGTLINNGHTLYNGQSLSSRPMQEIIADLNASKSDKYAWNYSIAPGVDPVPGFENWKP